MTVTFVEFSPTHDFLDYTGWLRKANLMEGRAVPLQAEGKDAEGAYHYVGETPVAHSGLHGFTVRVRPSHPDLSVAFVPGPICWAEEARTAPAVG